ncbi:MAG: prepilin-type N-terminal cleavage/methylation domain-containing protein [Firmicutes bacterium]|nr:prepilin-type N-terminal cleavage/methylation domain-containing protein [Bacillota bacterium]
MFKEEEGFTLVELITVVAIIAILGAVVTPNILKAIENSRVVAVVSDIKTIKNAALAYYADTGRWPENSSGDDPGFLNNQGSPVEGWNGPYLESWPQKNPWGGVYSLSCTGDKLFLHLTKVPAGALEKLEEKLGEKIGSRGNGQISISLAN